jgi:toxin ParE1/3/4
VAERDDREGEEPSQTRYAVIRQEILPEAEADVNELAIYFGEQASVDTAIRFMQNFYAEVSLLASFPGMGIACHFKRFDVATVRRFPIKRFRKLLVFYRPVPGGIEVVRVLHASRNWAALFA